MEKHRWGTLDGESTLNRAKVITSWAAVPYGLILYWYVPTQLFKLIYLHFIVQIPICI